MHSTVFISSVILFQHQMVAGKKQFLKDDKRFGSKLMLLEFLRVRAVFCCRVAGITSKRYRGAFRCILCNTRGHNIAQSIEREF